MEKFYYITLIKSIVDKNLIPPIPLICGKDRAIFDFFFMLQV